MKPKMKTKLKTDRNRLTHLWWFLTLILIRIKVFSVWAVKIALVILGVYLFWRGLFWVLHTVLSAIVMGGHH